MKILHIVDHMGLGGAQALVKMICESKKDFLCYALRRNKNETKIKSNNFYYRNTYNRFDFYAIVEIKKIIRDNNVGVIHCHLAKSCMIGFLLKKLFFKDVVLIFHEHGRVFRNQFFYNSFLKLAQNDANLFISVSKSTKEKLERYCKISDKKIKVLYNCIDLAVFSDKKDLNIKEERWKLGIDEGIFVVGFAGRLVACKGWKELVNSIKIVFKSHKNIRLLIAGEGSDKTKMLNYIKALEVDDKVIYIGPVFDMEKFYKYLDCLVIPSHHEAMGIAAIEARASGIPVIASDVGGLSEIINSNEDGLLFKTKNEIDLAKKIIYLYENNDLRNKFIEKGIESAQKFSCETYRKELELIYKELNVY